MKVWHAIFEGSVLRISPRIVDYHEKEINVRNEKFNVAVAALTVDKINLGHYFITCLVLIK